MASNTNLHLLSLLSFQKSFAFKKNHIKFTTTITDDSWLLKVFVNKSSANIYRYFLHSILITGLGCFSNEIKSVLDWFVYEWMDQIFFGLEISYKIWWNVGEDIKTLIFSTKFLFLLPSVDRFCNKYAAP